MTKPELKSKLENSFEYLNNELLKIRTGRASPSLLENITVTAYESTMTIKEVGSINVQDAKNLAVSPWDKGLLESISKAINESDLNLNSFVDGDVVRIPVPDLTEERRRELTKLVGSKVEEVRVSIRNIRKEAMKDIDLQYEKKEVSEDEKFGEKSDVDDIIKGYMDKVDDLGNSKEKELLNI